MKTKTTLRKLATLLIALAVIITSITIYQPQTVHATPKNRITLNSTKMTMYAGESYSLKALAIYQDGELKYPGIVEKGINYKVLKFDSNNKSVATVSKKGVITAKKKGTVKITVTSIYNSSVKGTLKLTVKAKPKKSTITLYNKSVSLGVGETTVICVKSVKGISSKDATFATSNKTVASVDADGWVKAKKKGTAKITVTSVRNKKAKTTFKVTVKESASQSTSAGAITLKKDYGAVYNIPISPNVPDKRYATTKIEVQSITGVKSKEVTYKSSDTRYATVDENGVVSYANTNGVRNGSIVTITVASKENPKIKTEFKVYVVYLGLWRNLLNNGSLYHNAGTVGDTFEKIPEDVKIIVTSSDESIIEICKNYSGTALLAKKKGTATITYQTKDGTFYWSNEVTVSDNRTSAYNAGGYPFYPEGNWWEF